MPEEAVISNVDAPNLYEIPLSLHDEGLDDYVCNLLRLLGRGSPELSFAGRRWCAGSNQPTSPVRIGLIGKYVNLPDAYLSVVEALRHGGYAHGAKVQLDWVQAEEVEGLMAEGRLRDLDGMIVPGGFGERGIEGMIAAVGYAREHQIPCLGPMPGPSGHGHRVRPQRRRPGTGQLPRVCAHFAPPGHRPHGRPARDREPVQLRRHYAPGHLPGQVAPGQPDGARSTATNLCSSATVTATRSTPDTAAGSNKAGLFCSGESPDGRLVEMIELPGHPFWVGTQAHPEFKSRPDRPHPLFSALVGAASARAEGRQPHLLDPDPSASTSATGTAGAWRGRRRPALPSAEFRKVAERPAYRSVAARRGRGDLRGTGRRALRP